MSINKDKRKLDTAAVHAEVEGYSSNLTASLADSKPPATPKAISVASFAGTYKKTVRPAMLLAVSVLRLFRRGDSANGVTQAIAFLDLIVGGGLPTE